MTAKTVPVVTTLLAFLGFPLLAGEEAARRPYGTAERPTEAPGAGSGRQPFGDQLTERIRREFDESLLSYGDAGLITLLRFEKAKLAREAGKRDVAIAELRRIIDQDLSETTTSVARWTLVEVLQEEGRMDDARAELEGMLRAVRNASRKRDALYGIIALSGSSPDARMRAVDSLIDALSRGALAFGAAAGDPRAIDLRPHTNATLENLHGREGNHITIAPGMHRFGGVDFRVGPGVVILGSRIYRKGPLEVKEIRVDRGVSKLHVLHGTGWGADIGTPEGTHIGNYVVRYATGKSVEVPVRYGVEVRDWWAVWGDPDKVSGGSLAWKGENALAAVRLYAMTWVNPEPDEIVATVDLISTNTDCAPFVVAITADPVSEAKARE